MKKSQNIFQCYYIPVLPIFVLPSGLPRFFFTGSLSIVNGRLDDDLARLEALVAEFWKYCANPSVQ